MKLQSLSGAAARRGVIAGAIAALCASLPFAGGAQSTPATPAAATQAGPNDFYTVVNIGPRYTWPLLNERGQVAYTLYNAIEANSSFFDGERVRPIGSLSGYYTAVRGLNNQGVVVGVSVTQSDPGVAHAFSWTPAGGTRALSGAAQSIAYDVNDRNEIVGWTSDGNAVRAIRWNPNEIVAESNAGLVLLRPGRHGTAAPVLGPVTGFPATLNPGQDVTLTVGFIDSSRTETHKASVVWSDGCASPAPTITESNGAGQVRLQHRACALGNQFVKVVVTDSGGRATEVQQEFVVQGPAPDALGRKLAPAGAAASAAVAAVDRSPPRR